jgi:hypothetical protein
MIFLLNNQTIKTMLITPQATKAKPYNSGYAPITDASSVKAVDDTLMSKETFFAEVDAALEEVRQGKVLYMLPEEALDEFLIRTQRCIE